MKYINLFSTQAAYDAANKYYPNVSYIEATDEVKYAESDPTLMIMKFTTTSANQRITICSDQSYFSSITVEGEPQTIGTGALSYTFATAGEHEVGFRSVDSTTLNGYAFNSVTAPVTATIPVSMTSVNFFYCNGLTSVRILGRPTSLSFSSCYNLTSVNNIPDSVTTINFNNCRALASVTIPDSVTSLGDNCFYETALTSITVPDTVTSIGKNCFYQCTSLASVTLGSGLTSIGESTFGRCGSLTSVTSLATTPPSYYSQYNNKLFYNVPATCAIYVPAASVNAYKAANGWSERADYIQAIQ